MDNSFSASNTKLKPHLTYEGLRTANFKSFTTFLIISGIAILCLYFGIKIGEYKTPDVVAPIQNNGAVTPPANDNLESPVASDSGSTITVDKYKQVGSFNGNHYHMSWEETWKTDSQGVIDSSEVGLVSVTPGVLTKVRESDDASSVIAENISFNDYELGNLTNFTEDQSVVAMTLQCRGACDSIDYLLLNLATGRAMYVNALSPSLKQKFKENNCYDLGFQNFIQNNMLFVCTDAEEVESIYKYNLSTGTSSLVEKLEATESTVCVPNSFETEVIKYSNAEGLSVGVCKKALGPKTALTRQVVVEDSLKP